MSGKRLFDIGISILGLVFSAPVMFGLALAVFISIGRPILFRQVRSGLGGVEFTLAKFRSMRNDYDSNGMLLPDDERLTATGRFMRRYRFDELPELLLIARGDMSFVGPRPLPQSLIKAHGVLLARSRVLPGLTGLAQVSGNTLLTDNEKFAIDLYYVDHMSGLRDLQIILKTAATVFRGEKRNEPLIREALKHASNPNRRGQWN